MLLCGDEMLGAYIVHSNIELAKYAAEHLLVSSLQESSKWSRCARIWKVYPQYKGSSGSRIPNIPPIKVCHIIWSHIKVPPKMSRIQHVIFMCGFVLCQVSTWEMWKSRKKCRSKYFSFELSYHAWYFTYSTYWMRPSNSLWFKARIYEYLAIWKWV